MFSPLAHDHVLEPPADREVPLGVEETESPVLNQPSAVSTSA